MHPMRMRAFMRLKDSWIAGAIFLIAFALRVVYLLESRADPLRDVVGRKWRQWSLFDSAYYHQLAVEYSEGELIPSLPYYLAPLYSYVLGGLYALFGIDLLGLRIFQCLLGSASCVLLFWIGRRIFSREVGILSGFLFAVYGLHIYYTVMVLPTLLVVFLNLLFLWLILGSDRGLTLGRSVLAGVALGLAVLAKPNALLLLVITLLIFFLLRRRWRGEALSRCAAAVAIACVLTIAPATLNNYLASGEFVGITTTGGRNFMKGNGPDADGSHGRFRGGIGIYAHFEQSITGKQAVNESSRMFREATAHMMQNPFSALKLLCKKSLLFVNQRELFVRDNAYFAERYSRLLRLPLPNFEWIGSLGLAGMVLAWGRRRECAFLYGLFFAQAISIVLIFVVARYRLVAVGCLILFASFFVLEIIEQIRTRQRRSIALAIATLIATTALVHIPFPEFPRDRGFVEKFKRLERASENE